MSKPMISVAGIRGIVGDSLRVEEFFRYVLAFATLSKGGKIIVGGDTRPSRHMLRHLAFAGLESAGCEIIDLGLVPTPTVGLMIRELGAAGGIAITASHNPAEWNAYKFFGSHGSFLDEDQKNELLAIAESGNFLRTNAKNLGYVTTLDTAIDLHVKRILAAIDVEAIRARKFKVAVDCVNGVGGLIAAPLLEALGCEATWLYIDTEGSFPRNPEPLPENLVELGEEVRRSGADVGFAIDPDADRLAVVDESGKALGEERTLVLAAWNALRRCNEGSGNCSMMVANLSSTRALDDVADEFGCDLKRTPIGEAWVVKAIMDNNAVIGGEGNGGVIYPTVHPGRDSATGMALILEAMAVAGRSISQLNSQFPGYEMIKTKFPATDEAVKNLKELVGDEFADASELVTIDGVKAVYPDKWVHVRPSGTEPVVRIFAEAPTTESAEDLISRAQKVF